MSKVTAYPSLASATDDDILYIVDNPGGTPASKKITKANFLLPLAVDTEKITLDSYQTLYHAAAFYSIILGNGGNNLTHNSGTQGYYNLILGDQAGLALTTGEMDFFAGEQAGMANTTGYYNTFLGGNSGIANVGGYENTFVGQAAGGSNVSGSDNTFFGQYTGYYSTAGENTFIGQEAGASNTTGEQNTFLGRLTGGSPFYNDPDLPGTNSRCIFIGYASGSRETGSDVLMIDNRQRDTENEHHIKAIIYGIMAAAPSDQTLTINAKTLIGSEGTAAGQLTVYYSTNVAPSLTHDAFAPFIINNAQTEIIFGIDNAGPYETYMQVRTGGVGTDLALNPLGGNVSIGQKAAASRLDIGAGAMTLSEMSAPGAPAANGAAIYAVDNGSGKTQLMVRFASGAAQQIAIEP